MKNVPDGILYHNPGNLRNFGEKWNGLDIVTTEKLRREAQREGDTGFYAFLTPADGIRAIVITLKTYSEKARAADGSAVDTIQELVERWAPASDNNPVESYVSFLCRETGARKHEEMDFYDYRTMRALVPAIIKFEQGCQPYSDAQIDKGLMMAGLTPDDKPISQSRSIRAATGIGIAGAAGILQEVGPTIEQVRPILGYLSWLPAWVPLAVILAGAAAVVYARRDDKRKGLR